MSEYYSEEQLPIMMTPQEVAAFLRVSKNTAYSFINSGLIPIVRVGRQIRIHRDDVIQYVSSHSVK